MLNKKIDVLARDIIFYQFDPTIGFWGIPNIQKRVQYTGKQAVDYIVKHNRYGNRDKDYDAESFKHSLVCLGGSNTWGSAVEQYERYTDYLQNTIDRQVVNSGHNSLGLDQICLTLLTKTKQYSPSTIIIEQYPWALHRVLTTVSNGYLKPYFYIDSQNSLKLKKVPSLAKIKLYRRLIGSYRLYLKYLKECSSGIDLQSDYDPSVDPIFLLWRSHYYDYMYKLVEKILIVIRDYCIENKCNLLFIVLPILQQFGKTSGSDLIDYNLPERHFIELLRKNEIVYLNMVEPLLQQSSVRNPLIQFDGHLNNKGHQLVAHNLKKELQKRKWL
jgi:hypothetical protein